MGLGDIAGRTGGQGYGISDLDGLQYALADIMQSIKQLNVAGGACRVKGRDPGVGAVGSAQWCGDRVLLAGRYDKPGKASFTYELTVGAQAVGKELAVELPTAGNDPWAGPNLPVLWANLRAAQMWQQLNEQPKFDDLAAMVALAQQFGLVTQATALMVLESDEDYYSRGLKRRPIDVILPGALPDFTMQRTLLQAVLLLADLPADVDGAELDGNLRIAASFHARGLYDAEVAQLQQIPACCWGQERLMLLKELTNLRRNLELQGRKPDLEVEWAGVPWYALAGANLSPQRVPLRQERPAERPVSIPGPVQEAERMLAVPIPKVDFTDVDLPTFFDWFRDVTGMSMVVDWSDLTASGVEKNTKVSLKLVRGVPAQRVLQIALDQAGGATAVLEGSVNEDGVLIIGTKDRLSRKTTVRAYDIHDMLAGLPSRQAPSHGSGLFGSSGGVFGSAGLFGSSNSAQSLEDTQQRLIEKTAASTDRTRIYDISDLVVRVPNFSAPRVGWTGNSASFSANEENIPVKMEVQDRLEALITEMVDRDTWVRNGGTIGVINTFNDKLIVAQTADNQRKIQDLLAMLRSGNPQERPADTEGMFAADAHLRPWVLDLLAAARDGKLSPYSSVAKRKLGRRLLVRIGGVWLDASLTIEHRICVVQRRSPAHDMLVWKAKELGECLQSPQQIVMAVGPVLAVTLDSRGLFKRDDPDVKLLLDAVKTPP